MSPSTGTDNQTALIPSSKLQNWLFIAQRQMSLWILPGSYPSDPELPNSIDTRDRLRIIFLWWSILEANPNIDQTYFDANHRHDWSSKENETRACYCRIQTVKHYSRAFSSEIQAPSLMQKEFDHHIVNWLWHHRSISDMEHCSSVTLHRINKNKYHINITNYKNKRLRHFYLFWQRLVPFR